MYFEREPNSKSNKVKFSFLFKDKPFSFYTDSGVFSKGEVDNGTQILLKSVKHVQGDVLDLGCGFGAVGVILKSFFDVNVTMSDVNLRALSLAEENLALNCVSGNVLESDGFSNITSFFDCILTNPPIRAGKQVIYRLFKESQMHLKEKGILYIVIRKQQGAESAIKYLKTLFEQVDVIEKSGGFWIIKATQKHIENV